MGSIVNNRQYMLVEGLVYLVLGQHEVEDFQQRKQV